MKLIRAKLVQVFIFILLTQVGSTLQAESECEEIKEGKVKIMDFFVKDFTMKTFIIQTVFDNHTALLENYDLEKKKPKMPVLINDIRMGNIRGSANEVQKGSTKLNWEVKPTREIDFQDACITLYDTNGNRTRFRYKIPDRMNKPGEQPNILGIEPKGGSIGDTMTLKVQNPGKDLDKISISILKSEKDQEKYKYKDKAACNIFPYYMSEEKIMGKGKNRKTYHEIKFTLSHYLSEECDIEYLYFEKLFGKSIQIKLYSNARPSKVETLILLSDHWKQFAVTMGLLITIIFMAMLAYLSKKINFFPDILLDTDTNSYSLANFQSFAWTIVLMGSYFYIAICQGLILGNPELPDFNFSLIALLGVSYGGMIASNYVDKRKKENITRKDKPELRDLIFDPHGGIDMARMQLFAFNMVSLILYVFYLIKSNPLVGLPTIPETLHTLLGTSQAGYIGSQAVTQMVSENNRNRNERQTQKTGRGKTRGT